MKNYDILITAQYITNRVDSNTHPQHMILLRTYDKYGKNTAFCETFMSTETFT